METIVYDFDGTIVSKDTGFEFYKWVILQSIPRFIVYFLASPIFIPFTLFRKSRWIGFSIISFIGTFAQTRSLFKLRSQFLDHYYSSQRGGFYKEALESISVHLDNGAKVIVISGCPEWILKGSLRRIGITNVSVIGSKLAMLGSGLIFLDHCYSKNKIAMAINRGFNPNLWSVGYSDSKADIHWLKNCQTVYLVNPKLRLLSFFKKNLGEKCAPKYWV